MRTIVMQFEIGEEVEIIALGYKGRVVALWITNAGSDYEVRYLHNGEQHKGYFYEDEIRKVEERG